MCTSSSSSLLGHVELKLQHINHESDLFGAAGQLYFHSSGHPRSGVICLDTLDTSAKYRRAEVLTQLDPDSQLSCFRNLKLPQNIIASINQKRRHIEHEQFPLGTL